MFVMINKDGGQFLGFVRGLNCYEGEYIAHGGLQLSLPTGENSENLTFHT